ncbi:hypothetical protein N7491_006584 [Penicillium cf. griseofulvum]|nr:hypothetical protein N7491_006584 [Penicillium cf. griseofulvum]
MIEPAWFLMENLQGDDPDMEKQYCVIHLGAEGRRGRRREREKRESYLAIYYYLDLSHMVQLPKAQTGTQQFWLKRYSTKKGAPKSRTEAIKAWEKAWDELPQ